MLILKIISIALGLSFTLLYWKQNDLTNGFKEDLKAGRKNADYARLIGLIELVAGITLLIVGIVLIIFV